MKIPIHLSKEKIQKAKDCQTIINYHVDQIGYWESIEYHDRATEEEIENAQHWISLSNFALCLAQRKLKILIYQAILKQVSAN